MKELVIVLYTTIVPKSECIYKHTQVYKFFIIFDANILYILDDLRGLIWNSFIYAQLILTFIRNWFSFSLNIVILSQLPYKYSYIMF